jgi:hypothetical protein
MSDLSRLMDDAVFERYTSGKIAVLQIIKSGIREKEAQLMAGKYAGNFVSSLIGEEIATAKASVHIRAKLMRRKKETESRRQKVRG